LCAGITVYNALRNSPARPGELFTIQAIGGLGHLAIQYANKMGFRTVAISSSEKKKELAMQLGAKHNINAGVDDPSEALQKLGRAKVILATAPGGESMEQLINGL
jgi:D-arabinose 1-dehydrogenase-like Zn-dependent alcohol dehydrogenase